MNQINYFPINAFRNQEHLQFMNDVNTLIRSNNTETLGIKTVYPALIAGITNEEKCLCTDQTSNKSDKIDELDKLQDKIWQAIYTKVKATLKSPFIEEQESAIHIKRIIDLYGNVRRMTYAEETSTLSNLIDDLQMPAFTDDINRVSISTWLLQLKKINSDLKNLLNEQNEEQTHCRTGDIRAARLLTDQSYQDIVSYINARLILGMTNQETEQFVSQLNENIECYKGILTTQQEHNNKTA